MSNISTFGTFGTARLGIYASQKALEVVGNNISNINTPNYTRQVLNQKALHVGGVDHYTMSSDVRVGAGALVTGVSQLRDPYLDIRYRNEMSNVGAADAKLAGLQELAGIFDEVGMGENKDGVLYLAMNNLFEKLQNLNTSGAGRDEYDGITRGAAEAVVRWFNDYADQIEALKKNHEAAYRQDVDRVNKVLTGIRDLSEQIRKEQIHGGDALELKDERNALIDELSGYMRIHVTYTDEDIGAGMTVEKLKIEMADKNSVMGGIPLIDGIYGAQISIQQLREQKKAANGDPLWYDKDGNEITDKTQAALDKDGNPIAVMEAVDPAEEDDLYRLQVSALKDRRDHIKPGDVDRIKDDLTHIEQDGEFYTAVGDNYMYGSLQSTREILTEKGEYSTDADVAIDKDCTTKRGIPYYEKAIDHLANIFAKWMNDANTVDPMRNPEFYEKGPNSADGALTFVDKNTGNEINPADYDPDDLSWMENVKVDPKYEKEYAAMKAGVLFSNSGEGDDPEGITAKNLSISKSWSTNAVHIVNTKDPDAILNQTTNNDNLNHFVAMMEQKFQFKPNDVVDNPDAYDGDKAYFEGTFFGMQNKINSTLAVDKKATEESLDNYSVASEDLYLARQGVSGVDLNDETVNMMQYQKSYTAACRLLTTIDEMLERLVTGTGIAGR
ncbi:MAG: hypothetical protein HFE88_05200 [Acutalibacter sp.]|jgi:flagellar hook-associated protein 1 FlgK|nr:hypothetical protein [Acutalibacter sp.]